MGAKKYNVVLKKDMNIGNKYLLHEYIDEGSYGYVWKALRYNDGQVVALKVPKNQESGDAALCEGTKLITVHHPNIIQIYWMGRVDGIFVIEMEYFPGRPLSKELDQHGFSVPRTFKTIFNLFNKILDGVAFMHEQKLGHGDLKPDNILIADQELKLTDFGTSRLIEDMFVKSIDGAGTWAYMAPEVAGSNKRYLNSDIYSLGVLLYQFLTGRTPHDTFIQVLNNVPFARPRELNPEISPLMEKVILKALERDPEQRYQTINDFRQEIAEATADSGNVTSDVKVVPAVSPRKTRDALEMAMLNCDLKKFTSAEKLLKQEIANGNKLPDLILQLAYVYYSTDRLFEALKIIESIDVKTVEDSRQPGFIEKRDYLLGRIYFSLKRYEDALQVYKNLSWANPENINYRYRLAVCQGICGFEEEAIQILEEINQETPGIWSVVKKLGFAYDQKGDHERARGYFKYARRLKPDDEEVNKRLEMYEFYL